MLTLSMSSCRRWTKQTGAIGAAALLASALFALPASAQEGKAPTPQKAKPATPPATSRPAAPPAPQLAAPTPAPVAADNDAARYCASVAPTVAEARIAWQTKKLAELDAQLRQRIADLEKAEAAARDWIARRDEAMKAASDDVVAIYGKMQAENAAREISAMDDRMAAAILARMKPNAAAAIFAEMETERASRLSGMIASGGEKKS